MSAAAQSLGIAGARSRLVYFAVYGRKTLVYSPEEEFAVRHLSS